MTSSATPALSVAPTGFRRVAPAFVLFFLSPFVAEFLLGNISISAIAALIILAPLYGGGALAVREIARRCGRGWATIVLLALAYGLIEEGIVIQTLFNPNYLGLHLLTEAYIPSLGIGGWWTPFVLTLHTVWSISVPIAIVEALFAERRETPWLGKTGLGVSIALLLIGGILIRFGTQKQGPFTASPLQLISATILVVLVSALAFRFKKKQRVALRRRTECLDCGNCDISPRTRIYERACRAPRMDGDGSVCGDLCDRDYTTLALVVPDQLVALAHARGGGRSDVDLCGDRVSPGTCHRSKRKR